jgi:alkaline phosphatase
MEDSIAEQLVRAAPDVAIGGGLAHFLPEGGGGTRGDARNLLAEAERAGIAVLRTWESPLPTSKKILALLSPSHTPHELDRRETPDLAELVAAAIDRLESTKKPWFLLVEEGHIDLSGHDHDAAGLAANTLRLDRCVAEIRRRVDPARTLVVLTADHATSSPSILEFARPESLAVATMSVEAMEERIFSGGAWVGTPRGLEAQAVETLDPGTRHTGLRPDDLDALLTAPTKSDRSAALGTIVSRRFGIAFLPLEDRERSTKVHGHTAELVAVRAWGPRAAEVRGLRDHAALGRWLRDVLGVTRRDAPGLSDSPARGRLPASIDTARAPS